MRRKVSCPAPTATSPDEVHAPLASEHSSLQAFSFSSQHFVPLLDDGPLEHLAGGQPERESSLADETFTRFRPAPPVPRFLIQQCPGKHAGNYPTGSSLPEACRADFTLECDLLRMHESLQADAKNGSMHAVYLSKCSTAFSMFGFVTSSPTDCRAELPPVTKVFMYTLFI